MNTEQLKDFKKPPESYWLSSTQPLNYPALDGDIEVDILIIGGGLAGIACAYQLLGQGASLAILEGNTVLGGVTAHTTAKITSQHGLIYDKSKPPWEMSWLSNTPMPINGRHEIKKFQTSMIYNAITLNLPVFTRKTIENREGSQCNRSWHQASFVDSIPFNMPIKGAVRFDIGPVSSSEFGLGVVNVANRSSNI